MAADGTILGTHRKINTLRVGAEAWSSPGDRGAPIPAEPFRRVGILICADAYSPGIARSLQAQGAQLLVSSAAWAQAFMGRTANGSAVPATRGARSWSAIEPGPTGRSTLRGPKA